MRTKNQILTQFLIYKRGKREEDDIFNTVSRTTVPVGAEKCIQTSVRCTQFLLSFLPSSLEISQVSHRGNCRDPLSTPILISRIPSSGNAAGRFFRAIEGDVCIIRREQTRTLKRAHWLLRWSQRLDMCIHADCEELAETCANTRSLPRRHETEAYSRGPGCLFYT